jgi:hypothetical protein
MRGIDDVGFGATISKVEGVTGKVEETVDE